MIPTIMPVTKVRGRLLELVKSAKNGLGEDVIITSDGEPAAVLMSFHDWESIMATFETKNNPELMRQIRKSAAYLKKGGKGKFIEDIDWGKM